MCILTMGGETNALLHTYPVMARVLQLHFCSRDDDMK